MGIVMGYPFAPNIRNVGINIMEALNDSRLVHLLEKKRIDAFMSNRVIMKSMECRTKPLRILPAKEPYYTLEGYIAYKDKSYAKLIEQLFEKYQHHFPLTYRNYDKFQQEFGIGTESMCR